MKMQWDNSKRIVTIHLPANTKAIEVKGYNSRGYFHTSGNSKKLRTDFKKWNSRRRIPAYVFSYMTDESQGILDDDDTEICSVKNEPVSDDDGDDKLVIADSPPSRPKEPESTVTQAQDPVPPPLFVLPPKKRKLMELHLKRNGPFRVPPEVTVTVGPDTPPPVDFPTPPPEKANDKPTFPVKPLQTTSSAQTPPPPTPNPNYRPKPVPPRPLLIPIPRKGPRATHQNLPQTVNPPNTPVLATPKPPSQHPLTSAYQNMAAHPNYRKLTPLDVAHMHHRQMQGIFGIGQPPVLYPVGHAFGPQRPQPISRPIWPQTTPNNPIVIDDCSPSHVPTPVPPPSQPVFPPQGNSMPQIPPPIPPPTPVPNSISISTPVSNPASISTVTFVLPNTPKNV